MKSKLMLLVAFVASLVGSVAIAAGLYTNGLPPAGGTAFPFTIPFTGNELLALDTQLSGGQSPQTESASLSQIASYVGSQPDNTNFLIGGDASTNLWQRNTTGASETTTYAYGGPDRWFYWSGTNTAMVVSRSSLAASLPGGYQYSFLMQRTASQTGVVQMCMAQVVATVNSLPMAGTTVELDFHAYTGPNFSAANQNMTAYIITGTGTDEGAQKLAYGLNAGGGGSVGWTGQANATAAVTGLQAVSTLGRYSVVANIPTTATEVAVALCYTPVGTAGTTDAVYFSGVQLTRNNALAGYASATTGYLSSAIPARSFQRRLPTVEAQLQYAYYYQINETGTSGSIQGPGGTYDTTTTCTIDFPLPAPMRQTPTLTLVSLSATTFKIIPTTTAVVLATPFGALQTGASNTTNGVVSFKTTAETAFTMCALESVAGSGAFAFNAEE